MSRCLNQFEKKNKKMSTPTQDIYQLNPKPKSAELEKARELIARGKSQAKSNRSKTPLEAWKKFERVRVEIREFVENQDN